MIDQLTTAHLILLVLWGVLVVMSATVWATTRRVWAAKLFLACLLPPLGALFVLMLLKDRKETPSPPPTAPRPEQGEFPPIELPPIVLDPTIMTAEDHHEIDTVPDPPDISDPDHPLNQEWAELRAELLAVDE
jgi:hypothetical protein